MATQDLETQYKLQLSRLSITRIQTDMHRVQPCWSTDSGLLVLSMQACTEGYIPMRLLEKRKTFRAQYRSVHGTTISALVDARNKHRDTVFVLFEEQVHSH